MRHRLFVHLTWTTRDRVPLVSARVATFLARLLPAIATQERASVLALGMVTTHVHLLLRLDPATSIGRLTQRLKGGSAALVNRELREKGGPAIRWAKGYNVESVSPRAVEAVSRYVECQAERHPDQAIEGWPGSAP